MSNSSKDTMINGKSTKIHTIIIMIIACSRQSEEYAKKIEEHTKNQQTSLGDIKTKIAAVSSVVAANTAAASESADIARAVSEEIDRMNAIVLSK